MSLWWSTSSAIMNRRNWQRREQFIGGVSWAGFGCHHLSWISVDFRLFLRFHSPVLEPEDQGDINLQNSDSLNPTIIKYQLFCLACVDLHEDFPSRYIRWLSKIQERLSSNEVLLKSLSITERQILLPNSEVKTSRPLGLFGSRSLHFRVGRSNLTLRYGNSLNIPSEDYYTKLSHHILICRSVNPRWWAISIRRRRVRYLFV